MKTYNEYYSIAKKELNRSLERMIETYHEEWWRKGTYTRGLATKGQYLETANILTVDEKNNCPIISNNTNVRNSEWGILLDMLAQVLIDWCVENVDYSELYSFDIKVGRAIDGDKNAYYSPTFKVAYWDNKKKTPTDKIENKSEFAGCCDALLDIIATFIEQNMIDIPLDWCEFYFGLDTLMSSCKKGMWTSDSDGYMQLIGENGNEEYMYSC